MTKTTKSISKTPAPESLDAEVVQFRAQFDDTSPLDEIVRAGARQMLQSAIEAEVDQFILEHSSKVDEQGRRLVVRNGSLPPREIATGAGPLEIRQPRALQRAPDNRVGVDRRHALRLPPCSTGKRRVGNGRLGFKGHGMG